MTVDLSSYKTPVFPSRNDTPVAPIAAKAGNGADLINRVNGLIDELQVALDSLSNNSGTALNWLAIAPASSDNEKIEVYYLNVSEHYLYESTGINLQLYDHLHTYTLGTDFTVGGTIDISNIIQQAGVGYYFFLFRLGDDTFKDDSRIGSISSNCKGATREFDKELLVAGHDAQNNSYISQRVKPLVVTMPSGSVTITLSDEQYQELG